MMYVELNGQRYALAGVNTVRGVTLELADTPVEDAAALARTLPQEITIREAGTDTVLWVFRGYEAAEMRYWPDTGRVVLALRRREASDRPQGREGAEMRYTYGRLIAARD